MSVSNFHASPNWTNSPRWDKHGTNNLDGFFPLHAENDKRSVSERGPGAIEMLLNVGRTQTGLTTNANEWSRSGEITPSCMLLATDGISDRGEIQSIDLYMKSICGASVARRTRFAGLDVRSCTVTGWQNTD